MKHPKKRRAPEPASLKSRPTPGDRIETADDSLREAEARLHASRARDLRFRDLLDDVPVPIWVTGPKGCEYLNRIMLAFLDVEADALLNRHWFEYVNPSDRERLLGRYAQALAGRKPFQEDVRLRRGDGAYRWMIVLGQPRLDPAGAATGFVGAMFDVTDFHGLVDDLRLADRRKNEFIAMLAHELRNPLTPMGNVAQMLKLPGVDEGTLAWAYEVLQRQLRNVRRLVDDLLDISRITQGKVELNVEPVDLPALLTRIADAVRTTLTAKQLTLALDLPRQPVTLQGDPTRLEQVFANLVNNAIKFTKPGGHIWIAASVAPAAHHVDVRVRDDGEGIPPAVLSRIFEPFTQGDPSVQREHGGLGIGLTLVRRLVELHGGSVDVTSAGLGQGCEFTVRLPLPRPY